MHYLFGADETLLQQLRQQVIDQINQNYQCFGKTLEKISSDWCRHFLLRPRRPREGGHILRQCRHHLQGILPCLQVGEPATIEAYTTCMIQEVVGVCPRTFRAQQPATPRPPPCCACPAVWFDHWETGALKDLIIFSQNHLFTCLLCQGAKIKEIRDLTGAQINVSQESLPDSNERTVEVKMSQI